MPVVAILALIGMAMLALTIWQKSMPGNVFVPAVIGLPVAQAQDRLRQAGLDYEVLKDSQPSETVPEGAVLSISPAEGRSVKEGRTIKILLSAGSAFAIVPDVRTLAKDAALALLAKDQLSVEAESYANDATIPTDHVIAISPLAGTKVASHSSVKLIFSKGPHLDTGETGASDTPHTDTLNIVIPADAAGAAEVRIEVTDDNGTHVVYRHSHAPGDSFVKTVTGQGDSSVIVYFGARQLITEQF
jgi:hypothetical protein